MTLEEFRNKMRPLSHYSKSELINAAWEEATKAERKAEREACAKVCEEEICSCCWSDDAQGAAEHLLETIRARSNE